MYKRFFIFLLQVLAGTISYAQNATISGRVVLGNNRKPDNYTVSLLDKKDSLLIRSQSFHTPVFKIERPEENCILKVSRIGYEEFFVDIAGGDGNKDIGTVALRENVYGLKDVVVSAKAPFFTMDRDKLIYNIENTTIANSGTVMDLMKKVPYIMVGRDNSISLVNRDKSLVLLNGREVKNQNELSTINSSRVSRVEIIENPGAQYEAEGHAVINIITRKSGIRGVNSAFYADYKQSKYGSGSFIPEVSYVWKGLSLYANIGMDMRNEGSTDLTTMKYNLPSYYFVSHSDTYHNRVKTKDLSYNVDASYTVNTHNLFGFYVNGYDQKVDHNVGNTLAVTRNDISSPALLSTQVIEDKPSQISGGLNYKYERESGLVIKSMVDYAREYGTTNTGIVETDDQTKAAYPMKSYSRLSDDIFSSKLDFSLPAAKLKGTFDFGAKYSYCYIKNINDFRRWNSSGSWVVDDALSNILHFREQIMAGYLTFSRQWKHFYYAAGLRVESSFTSNKSDMNDNYQKGTRLFPNIAFSYKSKTADYKLSYNKRITRPDYSSLNASVLYHDSLSTSQGNPELKATIYNTIAFSLLYMRKINFGMSYVFIQSPQDWLNINDKDNVERYTNYKVNTKKTYAVTSDLGGNFTVGRWSMQPTIVFLYRPYTIVDNGEEFSFKRCQYRINWTNQITLNHDWSIDADANFYKPGYSFTAFNHQLYLDLGVSKSLFDHRLFLQASVYRSFFNWKQSYDYSYKYYDAEFVDNDRFYCKFSLKYNLGVRHIRKNKSNQEELNRLGN